jgi:uncharacterized protein (TIGR02145 family)
MKAKFIIIILSFAVSLYGRNSTHACGGQMLMCDLLAAAVKVSRDYHDALIMHPSSNNKLVLDEINKINSSAGEGDTIIQMASTLPFLNGPFTVLNSINTSHTCGATNVHNPSVTYGSITDQQGNMYKTVQIGAQTWMAENLRTTIYRNGTPITNITDNTQCKNTTTAAYCNYNNDIVNDCPYGKLYNWYAVNSVNRLCPSGWRVASDADWTTLTTFLGGESIAANALKSAGIQYWQSPNSGATNNSGFSALPGGVRTNNFDFIGLFATIGEVGNWWSSTENTQSDINGDRAWSRNMSVSQGGIVNRSRPFKTEGYSVRCLLGSALPVDFLNVRAKLINHAVQIEWEIANEENLHQYEVERSINGKDYFVIGEQSPRNLSSSNTYSLLDKQPVSGSIFYRIKSVDNDGSFRYSATVKVNSGYNVNAVKVYPTTVEQSYFTLQFTEQAKSNFELTLINPTGQVVFNKNIRHQGGSANFKVNLNEVKLIPGIHFLSIKDEEGNKKSVKLIIKK